MNTHPLGFNNTGVICWCNSLIQSLLAVDHFYNFFKTTDKIGNTTTEKIFHILINKIELREDTQGLSIDILKSLIVDLQNKKRNIDIRMGQQSSSEGLVLLLEMMNNKNIDKMFDHVYEEIIKSNRTDEIISRTRSTNNIMYVFDEKYLLEYELNNYILKHEHNMEDTYIPDPNEYKDHIEGDKYRRMYILRRLPEIIIVSLNRYFTDGKNIIPRNPKIKLPDTLQFPHKNGKTLLYKKVSEIDHAGHLNGGHYIARALRNGKVYIFNDNSVADCRLETLPSTYLTFYNCHSLA